MTIFCVWLRELRGTSQIKSMSTVIAIAERNTDIVCCLG